MSHPFSLTAHSKRSRSVVCPSTISTSTRTETSSCTCMCTTLMALCSREPHMRVCTTEMADTIDPSSSPDLTSWVVSATVACGLEIARLTPTTSRCQFKIFLPSAFRVSSLVAATFRDSTARPLTTCSCSSTSWVSSTPSCERTTISPETTSLTLTTSPVASLGFNLRECRPQSAPLFTSDTP